MRMAAFEVVMVVVLRAAAPSAEAVLPYITQAAPNPFTLRSTFCISQGGWVGGYPLTSRVTAAIWPFWGPSGWRMAPSRGPVPGATTSARSGQRAATMRLTT